MPLLMLLSSLLLYSSPSQAQSFGDAFGSPFDGHPLRSYSYSISQKVEKNWCRTWDRSTEGACVWKFGVRRDGTIYDLKIKESSKSAKLDRLAHDAIVKAAPFQAIPKTPRKLPVLVEMRFLTSPPTFMVDCTGSALVAAISTVSDKPDANSRDLDRYLEEFKSSVQKLWTPITVEETQSACIIVTLQKNGKIKSMKMGRSSGSDDFDRRLREVATAALANKPLPDSAMSDASLRLTLRVEPQKTISTESATEGVDIGPYMAHVQRTIRKHWNPSPSCRDSRVMTNIQIDADGSISRLKVVQSSGDKNIDYAAMSAVRAAAPFGQLPRGLREPFDFLYTLSTSSSPDLLPEFLTVVTLPYGEAFKYCPLMCADASGGKPIADKAPPVDRKNSDEYRHFLENVTRKLKNSVP